LKLAVAVSLFCAAVSQTTIDVGSTSRTFDATSNAPISDIVAQTIADASFVGGVITTIISGEEILSADVASFTGDVAVALADARGCAPAQCTVQPLDTDEGDADGTIRFALSYSLTPGVYAAMHAVGSPEFDAVLTGVTLTGGAVVIEMFVSATADGVAPIEPAVVNGLRGVAAALAAHSPMSVSDTLSLCGTRVCNGRGTCHEGLCKCAGDWWGIDCETPCACKNGGVCDGGGMCTCEYPNHGRDCGKTRDCACT